MPIHGYVEEGGVDHGTQPARHEDGYQVYPWSIPFATTLLAELRGNRDDRARLDLREKAPWITDEVIRRTVDHARPKMGRESWTLADLFRPTIRDGVECFGHVKAFVALDDVGMNELLDTGRI
jgi:hypothetical protein